MDINEPILKYFSKFVFDHIGIVYSEVNYYQLETRLESAVAHFELQSVEQLHQKVAIHKDQEVIKYILDIATNNETSFFRDPKVFRELINKVVRPIAANKQSVRIWSAACSSGQEPYSLAMELENLKLVFPDLIYQIEATDFSHRILKKAESGLYSQLEVQRGLGSANLVKYFKQSEKTDPTGPLWEISPALRNRIRFSHFNLLEPLRQTGKFDVILCRNVLIYQDHNQKKEILKNMNKFLKPNGHLILGCAESVSGLNDLYEPVQFENARFFKNIAGSASEQKAS